MRCLHRRKKTGEKSTGLEVNQGGKKEQDSSARRRESEQERTLSKTDVTVTPTTVPVDIMDQISKETERVEKNLNDVTSSGGSEHTGLPHRDETPSRDQDKCSQFPDNSSSQSSKKMLCSCQERDNFGFLDQQPSQHPHCGGDHVPVSQTGDELDEADGSSGLDNSNKCKQDQQSAMVPLIRVRLLQSVKLLPHQSRPVLVEMGVGKCEGPLLIKSDEAVERAIGLRVQDSVVIPENSVAPLVVSNFSGFTQVVGEGVELGKAMEVTVEEPGELGKSGELEGNRFTGTVRRRDGHPSLYCFCQ